MKSNEEIPIEPDGFGVEVCSMNPFLNNTKIIFSGLFIASTRSMLARNPQESQKVV